METTPGNKPPIIKTLYLYVVSLVALFTVVFSLADIINIALRTYVFTAADQGYFGYYPEPACPVRTADAATSTKDVCISAKERETIDKKNNTAQKQRDLVRDISFIIVGVPLFLYHWRIIRKKETV